MPEAGKHGMIDIHSHILPGLDDGAKNMEEALLMCSIAQDDGITHIAATPHHLNGSYNNPRENVARAVASLNDALGERGAGITVLPGSDAYLDASLIEELKASRVMTLNDGGNFMLLELPRFFIAGQVREQVFRMKLIGITPIVTHPERNTTAMEDLALLCDLVRAGALIQVTAGSITGDFGSAVERNARRLIDLGMTHIVASDAHNSTSRPPRLSRAFKTLTEILGAEEARLAVMDRPAAIMAGTMPRINEPLKPKRKRTLFSFLGLGGDER